MRDSGNSKSVVVIGAGIAGLTAAYWLKKAGCAVTVLEASDRVGGRVRSENISGFSVDIGAQFLSTNYSVLYELTEDIGIEGDIKTISQWSAFIRGNKVRKVNSLRPWTMLTSGLLGLRDFFKLTKGTFKLQRNATGKSLSAYSDWAEFDDELAIDWISRTFSDSALDYVFEPIMEGFYFQEPETMSSAWAALVWSFGSQGSRVQATQSGFASIPEAVAKHLDVRLETSVNSVEYATTGCIVKTMRKSTSSASTRPPHGEYHADYVVLATTASVSKNIYKPETEIENTLLQTPYSQNLILFFLVPDGLKPEQLSSDIYGVLVPRKERQAIAAVGVESRKRRNNNGYKADILSVMLSDSMSRAYNERELDAVVDAVSAELNTLFSINPQALTLVHHHFWNEAMPLSPLGRSNAIRQYREEAFRQSKVLLAGDNMGGPCTECAAESGRWAANAIIARI